MSAKAKLAVPPGKGGKGAAPPPAAPPVNGEALQIYKEREQLRADADRIDKTRRDRLYFDETLARARFKEERQRYRELVKELAEEEQLSYAAYAKHTQWECMADASRLPDVNRPADINAFLEMWRARQESISHPVPETTIIASSSAGESGRRQLTFIRAEQRLSPRKRRDALKEELQQCYDAYELAEKMKEARDLRMASLGSAAAAMEASDAQSETLAEIYAQLRATFDFIAVNVLRYYDDVIDGEDGETFMRSVTADRPGVKFGMWVKTKDVTRTFTSLAFPAIEVRLDPSQNSQQRLPKALGLSRENAAVRAIQLAFNPFSCFRKRRTQFYALDCTLKVDLLTFDERPQRNGEWLLRGETQGSYALHVEEYPPRVGEARNEDPALRISFEVPNTIVCRQPSLFMGKWNEESLEWEPCSRAALGVSFGGAAHVTENSRRATFVVAELAQFAVLHETVYDAPYESWSVKPFNGNRLLISLEGRHRGGVTDRDFRFLLEDAKCRLLSPNDDALEPLRTDWWSPAALLRKLKQAGFNFLVRDEEAVFVENVTPKSRILEEKAYADMAQFCQYFTFASSHHNKYGEDADMALFRLSKAWLRPEEEDETFDLPTAVELWHSIRYRKEDCAIAAFTEDDEEADLNVIAGAETHYNLHSLLVPVEGEEVIRGQLLGTNYLLRRCALEFLRLVRPLSWG